MHATPISGVNRLVSNFSHRGKRFSPDDSATFVEDQRPVGLLADIGEPFTAEFGEICWFPAAIG